MMKFVTLICSDLSFLTLCRHQLSDNSSMTTYPGKCGEVGNL